MAPLNSFGSKGFTQQPGIDFTDTFSPVVKPTTLKTVLTIAHSRGWPIRQLDVQNSCLHGKHREEVYMSQPPGFVDSDHPQHACRLHNAIYGLKQSPRAWFFHLYSLIQEGFTASTSLTGTYQLVSELGTMATNNERIKSLEAGLGGLQDSFSRMEAGVADKFHQLEDAINKLSEALLSNRVASTANNLEFKANSPTGRSRNMRKESRDNSKVGRQLFSSKLAKLEFP
ncbi:PREDICTED: uncharacterized protein LOC104591377 [Nelumbo nucifera]|uniref:Uncharacterized protein LOC104591377 n=1 Tax=Nelumbo nucifera TaxID=4432 RepID=A0A1U7Z7R7_NELNU|nr:PREDICTED: uncharacterized protein LOC104591377 [Nelumbo nucifera]